MNYKQKLAVIIVKYTLCAAIGIWGCVLIVENSNWGVLSGILLITWANNVATKSNR